MRRERLRDKVVEYAVEHGEVPLFVQRATSQAEKTEERTEVFYTEGEDSLKEARLLIARYSLPRA